MALTYSPELIDYRLKSYTNEDGKHIIRGHLLGTKVADRGWSVSRDTIGELVKQFIGFPQIVSPKQFDPTEHFLVGKSYEDQLNQQKAVTKGKIINVLGPFSYHDGTNDVYYDYEADVTDEKVSNALETGRLPFGNSPYIWPLHESGVPFTLDEITRMEPIDRIAVRSWKPVHTALVGVSAFGDIAKISKHCIGPGKVCTQALAASSTDVAKILSSQIHSENLSNGNTMENTNLNPETNIEKHDPIEVVKDTNAAPIRAPEAKTQEVPEKQDDSRIVALEKELETERKTNQKLLTIHKKGELKSIFGDSKDENVDKLINKWSTAKEFDFDSLIEFASDLNGLKDSKKENVLAGQSINSNETVFPANNSPNTRINRLNREKSVTQYLGGPIS